MNIKKLAQEIIAISKPKKGDKYKLNWFTLKPDVKSDKEAIAFLEEGDIIELLDPTPKNHPYSIVPKTYEAKLIHTKSGKVSIKTHEDEKEHPLSEQIIIYISPNWFSKFEKI
jgi:hypothetical protein